MKKIIAVILVGTMVCGCDDKHAAQIQSQSTEILALKNQAAQSEIAISNLEDAVIDLQKWNEGFQQVNLAQLKTAKTNADNIREMASMMLDESAQKDRDAVKNTAAMDALTHRVEVLESK